ncbi:MAG: AbrB/MazE/SpoVT family DNA-binding domain-containing protein [Candidatus Marinimicrobia bacterium]|nr:AbrB/MazE/SpoVT family DNA-binding domain-containing protein [Candidatus Neomarinimicrobiota bacterium]
MRTKVTSRGQTSIPAKIRREFEINDKTMLDWEIEDGKIVVYPIPENPFKKFRGIFKDIGPSVADLLEQRRLDKEKEDKNLRT